MLRRFSPGLSGSSGSSTRFPKSMNDTPLDLSSPTGSLHHNDSWGNTFPSRSLSGSQSDGQYPVNDFSAEPQNDGMFLRDDTPLSFPSSSESQYDGHSVRSLDLQGSPETFGNNLQPESDSEDEDDGTGCVVKY